jgi:hypothetical protein
LFVVHNNSGDFMTAFRKLVAAAAVLAWYLAPGHAEAACGTSLASLNGGYATLITGARLANGSPNYQAGVVQFNGAGALSGNLYGSGGTRSAVSGGTYFQNSDCSLTIDLTVASTAYVFTVAVASNGEADGIEVDAGGVSNISFKPQATPNTSQNFTSSSLNGTFAASCSGPLSASSDLNLETFSNGTLSGTDPFNNGGSYAVSNVPYTGSYTVNTDGSFAGSLVVEGTSFDFYGALSYQNSQVEYIYANVANGVATTAFAACIGGTALGGSAVTTAPFTLTPASPTLSLLANQGGSDGITVTDSGGFSGAVSLSVSGLPAGASSAFVGNTLIVFPNSSTASGTYPLTITGTSGAYTATTTVTLVIGNAASFTLTPAAPSETVAPGGASSGDAVRIGGATGGFAGTVSFAASGLPSGVTAAFSPSSSTSGTTVTFTAASNAPAGTSTVTITGTAAATGNSNAFSETTTINVVVQ